MHHRGEPTISIIAFLKLKRFKYRYGIILHYITFYITLLLFLLLLLFSMGKTFFSTKICKSESTRVCSENRTHYSSNVSLHIWENKWYMQAQIFWGGVRTPPQKCFAPPQRHLAPPPKSFCTPQIIHILI